MLDHNKHATHLIHWTTSVAARFHLATCTTPRTSGLVRAHDCSDLDPAAQGEHVFVRPWRADLCKVTLLAGDVAGSCVRAAADVIVAAYGLKIGRSKRRTFIW